MESFAGDISVAGVECTTQGSGGLTTAIVQCVCGHTGVQRSCL